MDVSAELRAALEEAVSDMVRGREVAVAFSGGLDSGIVAAMAKEHASSVTLYTAGVKDAYDVRESAALAEELGMRWEDIVISEDDIEDSVREMMEVTGTVSPITLSFEIPLFYVSKYAKERYIIGGQGADELFAGYSKYVGLPEEEFRDMREADMARLFSETLKHERAVSERFGKEMLYPYLDRRVMDVVSRIDMKDLIPGEVRKSNLRAVAEAMGHPEIAAKKKKAAQYGSGSMNLLRKMAKRKGTTVSEMVKGMVGDGR